MEFGGVFGATVAACWTAALMVFDVAFRRLPNALTVPPAIVALIACLLAPFLGEATLLWALLWPGLYLFSPQGVGGGDVKLALPLAMVCVISGKLPAVLVAIGVSGLLTVLMAWLSRSRTVAHGPSMLATTWLVVMYFGV